MCVKKRNVTSPGGSARKPWYSASLRPRCQCNLRFHERRVLDPSSLHYPRTLITARLYFSVYTGSTYICLLSRRSRLAGTLWITEIVNEVSGAPMQISGSIYAVPYKYFFFFMFFICLIFFVLLWIHFRTPTSWVRVLANHLVSCPQIHRSAPIV